MDADREREIRETLRGWTPDPTAEARGAGEHQRIHKSVALDLLALLDEARAERDEALALDGLPLSEWPADARDKRHDLEIQAWAEEKREQARRAEKAEAERDALADENRVLRAGIAAAVPDYPQQPTDGSGHPWPLVPIAAVLAAEAKAAVTADERNGWTSAIAAAEAERDAWQAECRREVEATREATARASGLQVRAEKAEARCAALGVDPSGPPPTMATAYERVAAERDRLAAALAGLREAAHEFCQAVAAEEPGPAEVRLRTALASTDADLAARAVAEARAAALDEAAAIVEAYRKEKPPAPRQDTALHPAQRGHAEYLRGVASGERSALYSAVCRLQDRAAKERAR